VAAAGFSQEFILESLQAIGGADTTKYGFLVGAKLDVCQTNMPYNGNTPLGNCTAGVCSYPGYAQQTLTWNKPTLAADGNLEIVSGSATYRPTGSTSAQVGYGCYMTLAGSGSLGMAAPLDGAPVPLGTNLNFLELVVRIRITPNGITVQVN